MLTVVSVPYRWVGVCRSGCRRLARWDLNFSRLCRFARPLCNLGVEIPQFVALGLRRLAELSIRLARRCASVHSAARSKYPEKSFPDNVAEPIWEKLAEPPFTGDQLVCLGHDQAAWCGPASISSVLQVFPEGRGLLELLASAAVAMALL